MANVYCTGPVHLYVGLNISRSGSTGSTLMADLIAGANAASTSQIYYLGTCETAPKIQIDPKWKAIHADIGGDEVPFDWIFMGEDAKVAGVLTRWNESVYSALAARPRTSGTRGAATATDMGTLMLTDAVAVPLWLHFPYYSKAYGSTYNMPNGYRFFATWMMGPDEIETGTKVNKRLIRLQCNRVYKASDGTWQLYDGSMVNIPSVPPVGRTGQVSAG